MALGKAVSLCVYIYIYIYIYIYVGAVSLFENSSVQLSIYLIYIRKGDVIGGAL